MVLTDETKPERIALRVGPLGRLEGKIDREGEDRIGPIAIEVWKSRYTISAVGFEGGPIPIAADGSFATPKSLTQGDDYRLVIRAQGFALGFPLGSSSTRIPGDSRQLC